LVSSAGLWVELVALRKAVAARAAVGSSSTAAGGAVSARESDSGMAAPFAAAAAGGDAVSRQESPPPAVAIAASAVQGETESSAPSASRPGAQVLSFAKAVETAMPTAAASLSIVSEGGTAVPGGNGSAAAELEELRRKARRFARLLIDEIKLYNEAKLAEGRRARDMHARLKDEIDRSRAIYDKRYAHTPVADDDFFRRELVQNLADGDSSLLGSSFSR
jgi:hypothetical protein